ncbi:hypothetical protein BGZ54_008442, partial [Gamsiella multidivaricata]
MSVDGSDGDALFISPGSSCPPSPGSANLSRTSSGNNYAVKTFPYIGAPIHVALTKGDLTFYHRRAIGDRLRRVELISDGAQWPIQFDEQLERSLKSLADEHDVDVHVVLLSAWGALLSRLSGQSELDIAFREDAAMDASTYLPLHVDLLGDPNTVQLLEHVKRALLNNAASSSLCNKGHVARHQVSFYWFSQGHGPNAGELPSTLVSIESELELHLGYVDGHIQGAMRYAAALFDSPTIERHVGYLESMLRGLASDAMLPVAKVNIVSPAERTLLTETWSKTLPLPQGHYTIHQLFEEQVERTPEAIAFVQEDQALTYADLNARSNKLAHRLLELGVRPDTCVGLCVSRSTEMAVSILAIMKAGGAYIPLDPSYPSERLRNILADAAPSIMVVDKTGRAALDDSTLRSMTVLNSNESLAYQTTNPQVHGLTSRHLAYVIYTSGSTGKPKGVMVEHRGVSSFLQHHRELMGVQEHSRMLQFASISFDFSVWEIFLSLCSGAALYLAPDSIRMDRNQLWDYIIQQSITHATFTPSFLQDGNDLPRSTKPLTLVLGGEALGPSLLQNLIRQGYTVFNDFGPTEASVSCATWKCPAEYDGDVVPIGRPSGNARLYVLDDHQQLAPLGIVGELYIGGEGVARGYLNRPDLTMERFLLDPFSKQEHARMYKTGDLVRYLPDGNLVYLGRSDFQVKIRGFRIELGEIEAHLVEHEWVSEAVVLMLGDGDDKQLVAYVVSEPRKQLAHHLRSYLAVKLPQYMVPSAYVRLDAMPLTANEKLDRKALLAPNEDDFAREAYEAPRTDIEIMLAAIWSQLLKIERISRHDNFFALGGHSLLVARMIDHLRRIDLTVSVRSLFENPTLSALAQVARGYEAARIPLNLITPETKTLTPEMLPLIDLMQSDIDHIVQNIPGGVSNIQDIYALTTLQDGILFHHLLAKEGDPYLLTSTIAFETRTLLDRYLEAFQTVVDRHDILRTSFFWKDLSTSAQVVRRNASLPVLELSLDPTDGPINEQLNRRFNPKHYSIDLSQAPLLRFIVTQDTDGRWLLVQLIHHLIGDHAAEEEMHVEIKAILDGHGDSLPASLAFRDHLALVRLKSSPEDHEQFFKKMLIDVDEPTLPFSMTAVSDGGIEVKESYQILPQELNDRLRLQAKRLRVSLAALCHVAWAQVLARASGQQRVVFGTVLFGRLQTGNGSGHALGLSMNTLPFRCDVDDRSIRECVQDTHVQLTALLEHEHASLALAQRCSSVPAGTPLFSGLLNYRHSSLLSTNGVRTPNGELISQEGWFEYPGLEFLSSQERTNYPLTLSVEDFGTALGLTAQTMDPADPARLCAYMKQTLESLADALETGSSMPIWQLEVLPAEERELLLRTWNTTNEDYPADDCLHHLFEKQVERTPDAVAVVHEDQSLTYGELNARANCLAHRLIKLGAHPDTLVAICVERSLSMIVGILAILKAGSAYLPLDPFYAGDRLKDILQDAAPTIILADRTGRMALGGLALASLTVLDPNTHELSPKCNPQITGLTSHHLAYVIYTSGSTGKPKGVMIEHQGAVNLVYNRPKLFGIGPDSRVLQFTSLSFDHSMSEIFSALHGGASLYLLQDDIRLDRHRLWDYMARHSITQVSFTPSLLHDCKDMPALECLQALIVMGEDMPPSLPGSLKTVTPNSLIINDYGPTEISVAATVWKCTVDFSGEKVPIGRPLPNKTVYLLDMHGHPVPLGAIGEMYIGGIGMARGYLNRPDLTADRFLPDPFSGEAGARMYRTGDVAKYLSDGNIVCLGRNDHQVKIRGFRIELGEIEARLTENPLVSEAVVVAIGEASAKRLAAYVIIHHDRQTERSEEAAESHSAAQLASTLRYYLATRLPEYMVPAAFVRMDAFPLTPNGKLDRRALPVPGDLDFARQAYEEPQGEVEMLAQAIGQHRDIVVPPNLVTPDTRRITPDMLPLIDLNQMEINQIVKRVPGGAANIQDIYALSPLQDGILFHHLMAKGGDPYLLYSSMAFNDEASLGRYLASMKQIVNRHDILRTSFIWEKLSTPAQVVWRDAPLSITELKLDPASGPVAQQLKQMFDPRHHRIDLSQAPLLRFITAQGSDGRWILVRLLHHLIGDHSTLETIEDEIRAFSEGRGDTLPPAHHYRNLIAQARLGVSDESHERFFKEMLGGIDSPSLPFGIADVHGDGVEATESHRMLPRDMNDRLRSQARHLGVSVASLCHMAWAMVVARTSGQERVVFGTVLFGRMQADTSSDRAMGLFINTLPLRVDLDKDSVEESVRVTHARLAALLEHENASLALAQRCSGVPVGAPLFSSMLNYRHNSTDEEEAAGVYGAEFLESQERTNYPISLSVEEYGNSIGLTAQVVQPLDPSRICGYMQEALDRLTFALEHNRSTPAADLDIVPAEERQMLLQDWNATQEVYPDGICLHQLFEQQVERTPEAIAVVHGDESLTYVELNTRANRLAHHLITLGVQPDALVAICVERSFSVIVGILAILKAGGAYVPLDPSHASGRLFDILSDAAPSVLVADSYGLTALQGADLASLKVVDPTDSTSVSTANPHAPNVLSHHLAYVIYTSGSTGKPKGVMVEHRQVTRLFDATAAWYGFSEHDTWCLFHSYAFDVSVWEIWGSLRYGGKLVIISQAVARSPQDFYQLICDQAVTFLNMTPSAFMSITDTHTRLGLHNSLRYVVLAGEALVPTMLKPWFLAPGQNCPKIVNMYGTTETTVHATYRLMALEDCDQSTSAVGVRIPDLQTYVLNGNGQPVPVGAVGELYVGGAGVTRGYLNRPQLTAERFLPDPHVERPGARMYRTGDLVRYLQDGSLVYLGRNDHQVKIRGFRIELNEIEARLAEYPLVSEVVVVALGEESDKRLVAYFIAQSDEQIGQTADAGESSSIVDLASNLRFHLEERLPEYMIPAAFVCMDAFPLTPNGKLDRRALPEPKEDDFARQAYEEPQGEVEMAIAAMWTELLRVKRVS